MFRNALLLATLVLIALSAGLLFAFACSVNPGLHHLPDAAYLSAMQNINRAIQNPVFFLAFIGPVLLLPWSLWTVYRRSAKPAFTYLLLATALYLVGVLGVTLVGNVPLNDALESFQLAGASTEQMAAQRLAFEAPWGSWHLVRTVAAVAALLCSLLAYGAFRGNKLGV